MKYPDNADLIVAYSKNRVIGRDGLIPWNIEGEKKRFKELTTGNIVVMGRRTYEEIVRPLPNRLNIVLSNTKNFSGGNLITMKNLNEVFERFKDDSRRIYIAGGERLYREALNFVKNMYITLIDAYIEGDAYFPEFDQGLFDVSCEKSVDGDIPYRYMTYTRI